MEITPIIAAIVTALSAIFVAVINMGASNRHKVELERQRQRDIREEQRSELLLSVLRSERVHGTLLRATATAVRDGETNGEMSKALEKYDEFVANQEDIDDKCKLRSLSQTQTITFLAHRHRIGFIVAAIVAVILFIVVMLQYSALNTQVNYSKVLEEMIDEQETSSVREQ